MNTLLIDTPLTLHVTKNLPKNLVHDLISNNYDFYYHKWLFINLHITARGNVSTTFSYIMTPITNSLTNLTPEENAPSNLSINISLHNLPPSKR